AVAHGRTADAETLAKGKPATDAEAAAVLGTIARLRGQHDDARRLLEAGAAAAPAGEAALELGLLLLQQFGKADDARPHLERVLTSARAQDPESLFRGARAAHALDRIDDANSLFRAAARSGDPAAENAWGELFLETFNPAEALRSFQAVLKRDSEWAPAHLGVARTLANENPPEAAEAAERALKIYPEYADAELFLAELDLDNTRYDAARERIDRVLQRNPANLDARALLGAIAYVRGDQATFDAEARRVLAINPSFGEVYRVAGDLAARNYRFEEAVVLTRRAIALDPSNIRAASDLGLHLMRTGDEAEARQVLDRTFKAFPYDRVTFNLLALLDKLEKFEVVQDGDLIFKFHPDEATILREYAIPLAKDALKKLSALYEFTPTGPILIEIFPVHDDFAVRNLGLPGLVGALGACFGRVVSMDSPRAKAPGSFSWQATLWHELAHVITLQMSKQRVPRWLTEGISVHEEARERPTWSGEMAVPFAIAMERGQVLKLKDLNSGFTKPDTIALAYYQASLLVGHIAETHGEAALRALVRSYGDGLEGEAAITKSLGVSMDQLQATFDKMLDQRFGAVRTALRDAGKPAGGAAAGDIAALRTAAAQNPGSYRAQLLLGAALAKEGDKAAFEPLEKAAALVPVAVGEDSPHALMGRLAEQLGDTQRAIAEYAALLERDGTAIEAARRLADLATKANDQKLMSLAHERVVELDPFDASSHTGLGRVAIRAKNAPIAVREFKVALASGPVDRASAHCDLAESYLLAGRPADAKREALAALEIAPSFERAQELLLKAIDGGQPPPPPDPQPDAPSDR
ncbi:MAG TPA: tetratricopeptide repeat protein, partial [Vicinamibacterales bacterium]|nr:tetratricopeptide repeat protein [Vicinamibacterales bacterium]